MRFFARFALVPLASALLVTAQPRAATDEPSLNEVLARAGAYVTGFQRLLSGIVAEERYVQDIREFNTNALGRGPARFGSTHRDLKSDLLLVRPPGADRWIQFRDVFEVDGQAVRDRSERLMRLFVEPTSSTARQVDQIVSESARYNIGNILRTINVPVFALLVLEPRRQPHFKFSRARWTPPPAPARDTATVRDAWTVRYEEVGDGTMIRTSNDRDLPCRGRFWIEPATGRVLASELVANDVAVGATIVVAYQADVLKDVLVPVAMHEQYIERRSNSRIEGAAAYSRFRQFQVKVDEKIAPIKDRE